MLNRKFFAGLLILGLCIAPMSVVAPSLSRESALEATTTVAPATTTTTTAPVTTTIATPTGDKDATPSADQIREEIKKGKKMQPDEEANGLAFDNCWNLHREFLLAKAHHIEFFECVQAIFNPDLTPIPYAAFSYVKEALQKYQDAGHDIFYVKEPEFYSVIATPKQTKAMAPNYQHYKVAQALLTVYNEQQKPRKLKYPDDEAINARLAFIPKDLGRACYLYYARNNWHNDDNYKCDVMLEETWYCRHLMACLEPYLVELVTENTYHLPSHYAFYQCSKRHFTESRLYPFARRTELVAALEELHRPHMLGGKKVEVHPVVHKHVTPTYIPPYPWC